jgi:hypothetical protein
MRFKQFLSESNALYSEIVGIFKDELDKRVKGYDTQAHDDSRKVEPQLVVQGKWVEVRFKDLTGKEAPQSISFRVKDGQLDLANVYVPGSARSSGYMTDVLKRIRKLRGINGRCHVSVAMNKEGWKTILTRAGFEMV